MEFIRVGCGARFTVLAYGTLLYPDYLARPYSHSMVAGGLEEMS